MQVDADLTQDTPQLQCADLGVYLDGGPFENCCSDVVEVLKSKPFKLDPMPRQAQLLLDQHDYKAQESRSRVLAADRLVIRYFVHSQSQEWLNRESPL